MYLPSEITQSLERTNGILRQQTGRWHRRQHKFGKVWQQSAVTVRLVLTYFNWGATLDSGTRLPNELD